MKFDNSGTAGALPREKAALVRDERLLMFDTVLKRLYRRVSAVFLWY